MKKTYMLWLVLVLIPVAHAATEQIVKGTIDLKGDVSHDFGKTFVKVSPETARSPALVFRQTVEVTNNYGSDLYYFFDPYFTKEMREVSISEIHEKTVQVPNIITECNLVQDVNGTYNNVCFDVQQGTRSVVKQTLTGLTNKSAFWGNDVHYPTTQGVLIKNGETKKYRVKYRAPDSQGKWNARIWATSINDSVALEKGNAVLVATIDPVYSGIDPNFSISMNEGTGSTLTDDTGNYPVSNITGATWVDDCAEGSCLSFDGVNDLVNMPTAVLNGRTTYSVVLWIMNDTTPGASARETVAYETSLTFRITCQNVSGGQIYDQDIGSIGATDCGFDRNTWLMHATVKNGTRTALYQNGTYKGSGAGAGNTGTRPAFKLGHSAGNGYWGGAIDCFMVWTEYELTEQDITDLHNGGTASCYPFSSGGGGTPESVNYTFNTPVYEATRENFTITFEWDLATSNITNISSVNMTYNNTLINMDHYGGSANTTIFNLSIRTPIVSTNTTNIIFNFDYAINDTNGTYTNVTSTNNDNQAVQFAFYPEVLQHHLNITETNTTDINVTFFDHDGNFSDLTFLSVLEYNLSNSTGTFVSNSTANGNRIFDWDISTNLLPLPSDLYQYNISLQPWINLTFEGHSVERTLISADQTINRMVLENCNGLTVTSEAINWTILDEETGNQIDTADLDVTQVVYSENPNLNRSYSISYTNNATPRMCVFPTTGKINSVYTWEYEATGYTQRTQSNDMPLSTSSVNITLFLLNTSSGTNILFTVLNQNDEEQQGKTITVERFDGLGLYTFITEGQTDFQGQRQFFLSTTNEYRVNVSQDGILENLTTGDAASVGPFQIIQTSLTFRILTAPIGGVFGLQQNQLFMANLTQNGSHIRLDWADDVFNVSSAVNLTVYAVNGSNWTLNFNNGSTNRTGTLITGDLTTGLPLEYHGFAYITSASDGQIYQIGQITLDLRDSTDLGTDGLFLAWVAVITLTLLATWQPTIAGIMMLITLVATTWAGLYTVSILTLGGLAVAVFIFIIKQSKS